MPEIYKYRTQHLRGTKSDWTNVGVNVVPLDGEIVIEKDDSEKCLHRLKIGDGVTPFNDLPYMQGIPVDDEKYVDASLISNALKGNKSGEIVLITDVSPIEHNVGVKVRQGGADYNENLIPFPYDFMTGFDGTFPYVKESNGIIITVNEDKSIVLNGTATREFSFALCMVTDLGLDESKTYTFSGNAEGGYYLSTYYLGTAGGQLGSCGTFTNVSNTMWWQYKDTGVPIDIRVWSDTVCNNVVFKPKWEEGSKATSFYPPEEIDLTAVSVKKYGKNLWDEQTQTGHYSDTTGGHIDNKYLSSLNGIDVTALRGKSIYNCGVCSLYAFFYDINGSWISPQVVFNVGTAITIPNNAVTMQFNISSGYGTTYNNDICIALSNGDYEPFIEPTTYTPNENGIVEGVTSLYPNMTLIIEINSTTGVNQNYNNVYMDLIYNVDINKVDNVKIAVDQSYSSISSNPQSGKAVAEAIDNKQDKLTTGSNITIKDNVIDAKVNDKLSYTSKNPIENGKNWTFVNKLSGALATRERSWSDTQFKAISSDMYNVLEETFNSNYINTLLPNQNIEGITTSNSEYFDVEDNNVLTFKPSKITDSNGNYSYDGTRKLMLFTNPTNIVKFNFENPENYDITDYGYYTGDNTTGDGMFSIEDGILKVTDQNNKYTVGTLVLVKNNNPIELVAGKHYRISFKYRYDKAQTNNNPWIAVTQGANYSSVSNWVGVSADSSIMSDDGGYKYATSSADKNHRNYKENGVYVNRINNISTEWQTFTKDFIAYDVSSDDGKIKNYLCLTICAAANHSIEIDDIVVVEADGTYNTSLLRLDAGTYRIKYSYMMSGSLRDKLVNFKENNAWLEQPPFVKFMDNLDENSYKCADPYNGSGEGYNPDAIIIGENICKHMGTFWGNTWYDDEIIFKVPEGRSNTRLDKDGNEIQSGFFGIYIGNLYNDFSIKNIAIEKLKAVAEAIASKFIISETEPIDVPDGTVWIQPIV